MQSVIKTPKELCDYCEFMWGDDGDREQATLFLIKRFNESEEFRKIYAEALQMGCKEQYIIEPLLGALWQVAKPHVTAYSEGTFIVLRDLQRHEVFNDYEWPIVKSLARMFINSPEPIVFSATRIHEWENKLEFCDAILGVHWHDPVRPWALATVLDLLDGMVQGLDRERTKTIGSTIDVYQSKFGTYEPYESRYPNLAKFAKYYMENRLRL